MGWRVARTVLLCATVSSLGCYIDLGSEFPASNQLGDGAPGDADPGAGDSTPGDLGPGDTYIDPCDNGVRDGNETDVDCGNACPPCHGDEQCSVGTDCLSGTCRADKTCDCFGDCTTGMARLPDSCACIDEYEATVYAAANCTGTRYGETSDDLPAGFPRKVESEGFTGRINFGVNSHTLVPATVDVYACSFSGVTPTRFITWFQAKRACENSGKRLCSDAEWKLACAGDPPQLFPYGGVYNVTTCVAEQQVTGVEPTGNRADCHGAGFAATIFDMSGNLLEWVMHCPGLQCYVNGGSYFDAGVAHLSCDSGRELSVSSPVAVAGFRCCASL